MTKQFEHNGRSVCVKDFSEGEYCKYLMSNADGDFCSILLKELKAGKDGFLEPDNNCPIWNKTIDCK